MAGQLTVDTLRASTGVLATQNGMTGVCKAWGQFTNNPAGGTPVVTGSFNVSSITRAAGGTYLVSFTTAMPNINYSATASCANGSSNGASAYCQTFVYASSTGDVAPTTSGFYIQGRNPTTASAVDLDYCCFAVFSS